VDFLPWLLLWVVRLLVVRRLVVLLLVVLTAVIGRLALPAVPVGWLVDNWVGAVCLGSVVVVVVVDPGWGVRLGVGWRVCLAEALSPRVSLHMSAFPKSYLPTSPNHCFPLSPPHVCLWWMGRLPLRGLGLSPFGECVRLPTVLSPVSHCLPLSPIVSPHHACLCWMVHPPSRGIVPRCLPTCVPVLGGASTFPESCHPSSRIVSPHVCLCWMVRPPSRGLVSACLPLAPRMCACVGWCANLLESCLPLFTIVLSQLASHLVSQPVSLHVSPCGGLSHFAFSPKAKQRTYR